MGAVGEHTCRHARTQTHTCMHICTHVHTHACMHACRHTHTHTHSEWVAQDHTVGTLEKQSEDTHSTHNEVCG